ncbi:RagB/SusD family nutrient uptake outer membrane protein [Sphingobacterium sp. Ag1]|uniref:RagB/SusD family nutrient uptake outer membrane protein n=1 Tax=Sphingobacterium sp. Ag1 TaxID=1643451 RepID=UPI000A3FF4B9|nr:RagB/SusD family nutrient uptake outer membrane protein [Sphingobacterium sp. Ag1]
MRTIKILRLALLMSFAGLSACDNNLDINPADQYSEATYWKNSDEAMAALTGCYRVLLEGAGSNWFYETDMITPNGYAYNEANGTDAIARGVHNGLTALVTNRWQVAYKGIGRANTFLDRVQSIEMDGNLKKRAIGEAKFLRALNYFYLTDVFGGVPLILEQPNLEKQATLPRNSKAEVVEQILKDLAEAAESLPLKYGGADLGRATKGAALTLRARVLLYNERWAEAYADAQKVMDLNTYKLFDSYRGLFLLENELNSEVIFDVEYRMPRFFNSFDYVSFQLNRPAPTKDLIDAYLMDDGKPWNQSGQYDAAKPYEHRDPRLLQTINCIGYRYNGQITQASQVVNTGFGLKKYTSYKDDTNIPLIGNNGSELNPILIRYAEALLIFAEARNEASGPDAKVYDALNQLRQRKSVNMPKVEEGLNKEEMRNVIRRERRVELAFEGIYYSDIRRWKTAETANNQPVLNYKGEVVSRRTFDKNRDYLWPIPADQVQLNPALEQNPNWH